MPGLSELFRRYKREEKIVKEHKAEEVKEALVKTYLKAMPIRDLSDLDVVKNEVRSGNILILRITPLANKSVEDVKKAVNELCEFVESLGGDIARLGEERVVVCPPNVKIWREKPQVAKESVSTAA
ncbi:MAG: cell division protein SepF [Candidatus Bathyarchaeia archaeon]